MGALVSNDGRQRHIHGLDRTPAATWASENGAVCGFLMKKSDHLKQWRKRFFVLKTSTILYYFESSLDTLPKGVYDMDDLEWLVLDRPDGRQRFDLVERVDQRRRSAGVRRLQLQASDAPTLQKWIGALEQESFATVKVERDMYKQQSQTLQAELARLDHLLAARPRLSSAGSVTSVLTDMDHGHDDHEGAEERKEPAPPQPPVERPSEVWAHREDVLLNEIKQLQAAAVAAKHREAALERSKDELLQRFLALEGDKAAMQAEMAADAQRQLRRAEAEFSQMAEMDKALWRGKFAEQQEQIADLTERLAAAEERAAAQEAAAAELARHRKVLAHEVRGLRSAAAAALEPERERGESEADVVLQQTPMSPEIKPEVEALDFSALDVGPAAGHNPRFQWNTPEVSAPGPAPAEQPAVVATLREGASAAAQRLAALGSSIRAASVSSSTASTGDESPSEEDAPLWQRIAALRRASSGASAAASGGSEEEGEGEGGGEGEEEAPGLLARKGSATLDALSAFGSRLRSTEDPAGTTAALSENQRKRLEKQGRIKKR